MGQKHPGIDPCERQRRSPGRAADQALSRRARRGRRSRCGGVRAWGLPERAAPRHLRGPLLPRPDRGRSAGPVPRRSRSRLPTATSTPLLPVGLTYVQWRRTMTGTATGDRDGTRPLHGRASGTFGFSPPGGHVYVSDCRTCAHPALVLRKRWVTGVRYRLGLSAVLSAGRPVGVNPQGLNPRLWAGSRSPRRPPGARRGSPPGQCRPHASGDRRTGRGRSRVG